jgi:CheY-like chemotaxis protein
MLPQGWPGVNLGSEKDGNNLPAHAKAPKIVSRAIAAVGVGCAGIRVDTPRRQRPLASQARRVFIQRGHQEMNEPKATSAESGQSSGALIYVVDDEPMLLELASVILEPLGYTIETFRAPETALRAFRAAAPPPALIITDYAMHTMTGLELVEACRQIRPQQKVLMLSGTVGRDVCLNAPVKPDRFLAKPYQSKQLIEAVEATLAD